MGLYDEESNSLLDKIKGVLYGRGQHFEKNAAAQRYPGGFMEPPTGIGQLGVTPYTGMEVQSAQKMAKEFGLDPSNMAQLTEFAKATEGRRTPQADHMLRVLTSTQP
jgi:hypothetical protein